MEKTLLLVVSFGTTHDIACEKSIGRTEKHLREAFPGMEVRRAFTSNMIRKALLKRGVIVEDVTSALKRAVHNGFTRVVMQPTHLLYGDEYEKMCAQAEAYKTAFSSFVIGKPLLADTQDLKDTAEVLANAFPESKDTALVLMGHGTEHYVNPVYAAMQTVFRLMGRQDVFVGTVEAWPGIDEILQQLDKRYTKAVLAPLMLVAGDHAVNDMAGDGDDSWKVMIEAKGIQTQPALYGLGEYEGIREIYARHVKNVIQTDSSLMRDYWRLIKQQPIGRS